MMRYQLALIHDQKTLTAVVLRARLGLPSLAGVFRRALEGGAHGALQALRKDCEAAGYGAAWHNAAMLCLDAQDAVFHDFMLPTANAGMARKTIPLLLESEFPFEPAEFALNTRFFRYGAKKQLGALVTLLPNKILDEWRNALEECGLPGARVFVSPWPVIAASRAKNALLLCLADKNGSLAALDANGNPMRIQSFSLNSSAAPSGESLAADCYRKCGLLLSGLAFRPASLVLAGEALPPGIEENFARVFGLPVTRANARGNSDHTGRSDLAWLKAVGMYRQALSAWARIPVFGLRLEKSAAPKRIRGLLPGAACAFALFAAMGVASFLDSLEYRSKAAILRAGMFEKLKEALPDAPKNAGAGKLRAILKSRIAQYESGAQGESGPIVLEIMENIHAAVPASLDIDVHRLLVDDKHVRIYGHAGSYDDVNAMKEKLEAIRGISGSRIVGAASRAGRNNRPLVEFELDLTRAAAP